VSTPGKLKSLLDRGWNRTLDLWLLYQLSYEVKSVRVRDILELSLLYCTTPERKKTG
jgi:hypothetical protein